MVVGLVYLIERRLFSEAVIHAARTARIKTTATVRVRTQFLVIR